MFYSPEILNHDILLLGLVLFVAREILSAIIIDDGGFLVLLLSLLVTVLILSLGVEIEDGLNMFEVALNNESKVEVIFGPNIEGESSITAFTLLSPKGLGAGKLIG